MGIVYRRNVILVDPARFVPGRPGAPADDLQAMAKAYIAKFGAPPPPPKPDAEPVAELLVSAAPVRAEQMARFKRMPPPTLILATHTHTDHLDPRAIASLRTPDSARHRPASSTAMLLDVQGAEPMVNGDRKVVGEVTIDAVPMYNPKPDRKFGFVFHPKGRGNGYVLTLGGFRVYVAGDTACTPEMMALPNITVAFVPMNLPYTMTPAEAAECVRAMRPRIVYPYHYFESDPKVFETALQGSGIDVRVRVSDRSAPCFFREVNPEGGQRSAAAQSRGSPPC